MTSPTVTTPIPANSLRRWLRQHAKFELILGIVFTGGITLMVLLSWWLFPHGGNTIDLSARLTLPFRDIHHLLGTDPLGRDMLARIVVGGRISLTIGILSVLGAVILGVIIGIIAGYYEGIWDTLLMRCVDVQLALPFILIAITFISIVGGSVENLIIFMILAQWVQYARLVRALVMELKVREFIQAARAFGVGDLAQIWHHFLPNLMGPVVILMALNVGNNILLASSLTFLGLGVDPTIASWGGMLADGRTYLQTAWWVTVFPGLAIMLTVLGLNLLADWSRDRLDPTGKA